MNNGKCSSTIEDYRSVHDAKCMQKASYLTDLKAGARECLMLRTKDTCNKEKSCFWYVYPLHHLLFV